MKYEINISLDGKHYCSVTRRGLSYNDEAARRLLEDLATRFRPSEGFKLVLRKESTVIEELVIFNP